MVVGLEKGLVVTKEERDEGVRHKIIGLGTLNWGNVRPGLDLGRGVALGHSNTQKKNRYTKKKMIIDAEFIRLTIGINYLG